MRKIIALILAVLVFGCAQEKIDEKQVMIKTSGDEIKLNVEIADSSAEIIKGLMHREKLGENEGMLFVFPDEDYRNFWMKNTLIPLDLLFIAANGTIVDMKESFQPCKTEFCESYKSKEKAKYVLEVNGGFAGENEISTGDYVNIINQ